MKDFYDLRSKVVHGSELRPKHRTRLELVDDLREIVRQTLVTVMALIAEGMSKPERDELLVEIQLDEARREKAQEIASRLLYIADNLPPTVQ